ncbi:MAG TPA: phasin family protein [Xanthobacteraceae bacterium]|nr:phasin family protein [Xanthobacteraceae bacterium]
MAKDTENLKEQAVKQAEQVVEKTIDQTRGAVDNYFNFMENAFSSYPGGTELAEKMRSYTEQNLSAAQEFVQKLGRAKDFQDIIRIQTKFMQTQFSICAEQTRGLTEAFTKAATSALKPPKN